MTTQNSTINLTDYTLLCQKDNIYNACKDLFSEAAASDYIQAINVFVRQHVENPTQEESTNLYNILKLIEILARLERSVG